MTFFELFMEKKITFFPHTAIQKRLFLRKLKMSGHKVGRGGARGEGYMPLSPNDTCGGVC